MFKKAMITVAAGLFATSVAQADYFDPEDAVQYRQALYQVIGAQMSVLGGMVVQGTIEFNANEVHQRAQNIAQAAELLPETYFPETRSVSESGMRDRAWNNMADFQSKGENFGKALSDLLEASASADLDPRQARSKFGALVQSCRSCHDDYRAR